MERKIQSSSPDVKDYPDNKLLSMLLTTSHVEYYSLERSSSILGACQGSVKKLYTAPLNVLTETISIKLPDAYRLKAAFELNNRSLTAEILGKPKINNSKVVYSLFMQLCDTPYEQFWIVVLNHANRVVDRLMISEGGICGTVVDPKKVFKLALDAYACGLILVHNHPSGNINPSEADKSITTNLVSAGKMLDIVVLDHIIVGNCEYFSFADSGLL